jgi:hypothetical protein
MAGGALGCGAADAVGHRLVDSPRRDTARKRLQKQGQHEAAAAAAAAPAAARPGLRVVLPDDCAALDAFALAPLSAPLPRGYGGGQVGLYGQAHAGPSSAHAYGTAPTGGGGGVPGSGLFGGGTAGAVVAAATAAGGFKVLHGMSPGDLAFDEPRCGPGEPLISTEVVPDAPGLPAAAAAAGMAAAAAAMRSAFAAQGQGAGVAGQGYGWRLGAQAAPAPWQAAPGGTGGSQPHPPAGMTRHGSICLDACAERADHMQSVLGRLQSAQAEAPGPQHQQQLLLQQQADLEAAINTAFQMPTFFSQHRAAAGAGAEQQQQQQQQLRRPPRPATAEPMHGRGHWVPPRP